MAIAVTTAGNPQRAIPATCPWCLAQFTFTKKDATGRSEGATPELVIRCPTCHSPVTKALP